VSCRNDVGGWQPQRANRETGEARNRNSPRGKDAV
jgi:hypothetical protein